MFGIASILNLLNAVGPITAALPEFKSVYDDIVKTFDSKTDQNTLKAAYAASVKDNEEGHAELQQLLAQAAKE